MPVRAVTPLVEPHHIVIIPCADSDHQNYDAARDELAVPDPVAIPLRNRTRETIAYSYVDAGDAHLADFRWYRAAAGGYAVRRERGRDGRLVYMHRQILELRPGDGRQVDHIDGNSLNNRRANLRIVTNAENGQNIHRVKASSSRYRGVSWHKLRCKWHARIVVAGKERHLGLYDTEEEEAAVAVAARAKLFTHANEDRHEHVAA